MAKRWIRCAVTLVICALALGLGTGCRPRSAPSESDVPRDDALELWNLTDQHRRDQGFSTLERDPLLDQLAREHSALMLQEKRLSHDGADERFEMLQERLGLRSLAENVASACGHGEAADAIIMQGWQESEGHRRNLDGPYSLGGLGVAKGGGCVFATQIFGGFVAGGTQR